METGRARFCAMSFVALLLAIPACTSQTVKMIQPQTGATAECSGSSVGIGPLFSESFVDGCSRAYENRGYVAVQRLTPEERASSRAARPTTQRLADAQIARINRRARSFRSFDGFSDRRWRSLTPSGARRSNDPSFCRIELRKVRTSSSVAPPRITNL